MTTTMQPIATPRKRPIDDGHPDRWRVLIVLVAVAFMAQLDFFIVNVAIPAMGETFHGASLSALSWVLDAYAIVFAALLVPAGRLADHFGRRRFLLAGLGIFTLASVACALAPELGVLIAARAVQAVGAAMILPTSLGLLLGTFPAGQHSLVVGIWAGAAAVAASAGVSLGGLLVTVDWRWIFLVNVPIGVLAFAAGVRVLPEVRANAGARLPDATSTLALLLAVTLLVLATVQGPVWGWDSGLVVAVLLSAALAGAVTVRRTLSHPAALIEPALFANREFTSATIALFLFYIAMASWLLVTVLFLQDLWHWSPVRLGLAIAPAPIVSGAFAVNGGRIAERFGRTRPAALGPLLMALGALFWIVLTPTHPSYVVLFLPGLLIAGAGAGLTQAPLFAAATTLPPDRSSTGSAVLNMARQIGGAVGVALLVALLASAHPSSLEAIQRGWALMALSAGGASIAVFAIRLGYWLPVGVRRGKRATSLSPQYPLRQRRREPGTARGAARRYRSAAERYR